MDKIIKFFECLVPNSICNLKCEYCYIIQKEQREMKKADFQYTPKQIGKAFSQKRLGGICFVSICGSGETLVQDEVVAIVYEILSQGHYVNITNNGTMSKNIQKLMQFPTEYLQRLYFSFSFHYLELKRLKLLDTFFDNVRFVKSKGCSYMVQLNLCDSYIANLEDIKNICIKNIGVLPQVAVTRDESQIGYRFFTSLSDEEYIKYGESFSSKMFQLGVENMHRKQTQFCYAGSWSYRINLANGLSRRCYAEPDSFNFFENPDCPIPEEPIGTFCQSAYCINSIHFLALGVVPDYPCGSYAEIRNRICEDGTSFFNKRCYDVLSQKLYENNTVLKEENLN